MAVVSTVVVRVSLGLSLPLAVVNSVAVAVGGVAIAVGPVATVQQVGISSGLGLSLSLPLAVVKSMAVAVGPVAKSMVAQSVVAVVGLSGSLRLSLGFPLAIVKSVAVAVVAKTVASVEEVGVSLCLGFRLSSSDGRESENYEQFHVECRMSRSQLCSPC